MSNAIGGKKREFREIDFSKKVGMGEFEVVGVNPDREELESLLGTTLEKDPEYLGEKQTDDGKKVATVRISFYLKEVKDGGIYNVSFFLENRTRTNKEGNKTQYINNTGQCVWVEDDSVFEEEKYAWFAKDRDVREAKVGEEELYNFLRVWLRRLDFQDIDTVLSLDTKKLFKGNVRDLSDQVGGELVEYSDEKGREVKATVCCLLTVKTKQVDGEKKSMQVVNNKNFLPGFSIKNFNGKKYTLKDAQPYIDILKGDDKEAKKKVKGFQRFLASVLDEEHGVKEFYGKYLSTMRDYNESEDPAASDEVMATAGEEEEDDSDY